MDWTRPVDTYCERLGPGYWAEPVNALTNLAFLLAAFVLWRRLRGQRLPLGRAMVAVLAAIGVGSWLFHTHATAWAGLADVLPIAGFILLYLYAANRLFWGLRLWPALALTALFLPYAAAAVPLFSRVPGLGSSAGYAPVPLLILIYAALLRRRAPATARGLAAGAGILIVSLAFRTLDGPLCALWPPGTHFLWHVLNALMLGWMIETYRRHMLAAPRAQG
ncbi:ceramidase domain-containing protein [Actibacterium sp. MT2.3-13A]|uniref:ceramidase domain-containing protein n=1 Tax=Actibacterium sp. MT2.3-13A TaxID=2828332 RepID=UPI001BAB58D3|nr:ceramidase domain-containing protein [Actibacterium sp. MT2.3-13A]